MSGPVLLHTNKLGIKTSKRAQWLFGLRIGEYKRAEQRSIKEAKGKRPKLANQCFLWRFLDVDVLPFCFLTMQIHAKDMKHVTVTEPPNSGPDSSESDNDLRQLAPPPVKIQRKILSKQLSMCETKRERAWEKRRMQILRRNNSNCGFDSGDDSTDGFRSPRFHGSNLTDEDMSELKGSIELGFGFNEEDGQDLCETLPALDLYFAVNRQYSDGKHGSSSPVSILGSSYSSTSASPKSPNNDSWKIFSRGDKPQHVKTRLRHWAQAVACSVRQCY